MSCDVGEVTESLENQNELWRRWSDWKLGEWAPLIIQAFRRFTYVTTHSPTLTSLYLRHSAFSNPFVASPMSQIILQPFFRFSYVTSYSPIVRPRYVQSTCKQSQVKAKSAVHKMHFLTGWKTYSEHRYNIIIQHGLPLITVCRIVGSNINNNVSNLFHTVVNTPDRSSSFSITCFIHFCRWSNLSLARVSWLVT